MRLKRTKPHRQGAHLILYGPKGAPTHARLATRSESFHVETDTPEGFLLELADEEKYASMIPPGRRFRT